jgi:ABC-2 type transport system ATP-binding protein
MSTAPPLVLDRVDKALAGQPVLHGVSFTCPAGEITALLGPNGAGKTTTVAVATGLRRPDTGRAEVFGVAVGDATARQRVSLVPQDIGFPDAVTVGRCLDFVAGQRPDLGLAPPPVQLYDRLGIAELLGRRAGGLSGGQRRKLAVALGLIHAPGLLIMDEATTNLDETTRAGTWQLVREYVGRGGAAVVTSHILADIDTHADRVVALNSGRVVLHSPLAEVRARLGGSTVSLRVPPQDQQAALAVTAAHGLGTALPRQTDGLLQWRTHAPLDLVVTVAAVAPRASDLDVRPTPLSELLSTVAPGTGTAEPSDPRGRRSSSASAAEGACR